MISRVFIFKVNFLIIFNKLKKKSGRKRHAPAKQQWWMETISESLSVFYVTDLLFYEEIHNIRK